jgi:antitoxin MazE
MKALSVNIRRIGNSLGIVIPKPLLAQVGLADQADLTVELGAIVLRKPSKVVRAGWANAALAVANGDEDALLMGEFANAVDAEFEW